MMASLREPGTTWVGAISVEARQNIESSKLSQRPSAMCWRLSPWPPAPRIALAAITIRGLRAGCDTAAGAVTDLIGVQRIRALVRRPTGDGRSARGWLR